MKNARVDQVARSSLEEAQGNENPVRMAYVGCVFMAQQVHLPNFSSLEGCSLVALAELRPLLAQQVAEQYRIPAVYPSHLELAADSSVEAVGVSGGYAEQGEIATDLLRAGKHVYMEKPMAISITQAERLLDAARSGNARLMIAYLKRYDSGNNLARETISRWKASGAMGEVLYARNHGFLGDWLAGLEHGQMITTNEPVKPASYSEHLPAWLPEEKGSSYIDYLQQYTHNVNLLRYLLDIGDDVSVRAVDLNADGKTGIVVLDLAGIRGVIESGHLAYHHWDEHTQVYFQKGWVHTHAPPFFARPAHSRVECYEGGERHRYSYPIPEPKSAWPYREEAAFFVRALRTGESFRSSGEDALTDVRVIEEIYKQHLAPSCKSRD
jgi:predicted dehydrogenase